MIFFGKNVERKLKIFMSAHLQLNVCGCDVQLRLGNGTGCPLLCCSIFIRCTLTPIILASRKCEQPGSGRDAPCVELLASTEIFEVEEVDSDAKTAGRLFTYVRLLPMKRI